MAEDDGEAASIVEHLLMDDGYDGDDTDEDKDADDADPATTDAIQDLGYLSVRVVDIDSAIIHREADEQQDTNATIEYLIICGNYYQHRQQRMSEWERQNGIF